MFGLALWKNGVIPPSSLIAPLFASVLISVDSSVHMEKEHLFTLKIVSCTHHQTVLGEGVNSVCVLVKYSLEG